MPYFTLLVQCILQWITPYVVSQDVIVLRDSPPPQLGMPNHQNQGIQ